MNNLIQNFSKLCRAATIASRAFGGRAAEIRTIYLAQLFSVTVSGSQNVHLTHDRQGMFALVPNQPAITLMRAGGFLLSLCAPAVAGLLLERNWLQSNMAFIFGLAISGLMLVWLVLGISMMTKLGGSTTLNLDSLPEGRLYILSALCQIPGTKSGVLVDARSAISSLSVGSVVATAAENSEMAKRYEKLGFIRGTGLQLHLCV